MMAADEARAGSSPHLIGPAGGARTTSCACCAHPTKVMTATRIAFIDDRSSAPLSG
jgi:ABC-type cobalamin transport system ATPase subunit